MIHPTAIIDDAVELGEDIEVGAYAIITGRVRIGARSRISPHAVIGGAPQYRGYWPAPESNERVGAGVLIGEDVCVREHAQIHHGVQWPTVIGDRVLIMAMTHTGHDSRIGDDATLSVGSCLGGFVTIQRRANIGMGVIIHPWAIIGEGAMVGLNSGVVKDVPPYAKVAGSPARIIGANQRLDARLGSEYLIHEVSQDARVAYVDAMDQREGRRAVRGKR
jgi:UDP-N-acetylglucosamine acyltransferase